MSAINSPANIGSGFRRSFGCALRAVKVPTRPPAYCQQCPQTVIRRIRAQQRRTTPAESAAKPNNGSTVRQATVLWAEDAGERLTLGLGGLLHVPFPRAEFRDEDTELLGQILLP